MVQASAWWLPSGQTVGFCPSTQGTTVSYDNGNVICTHASEEGIQDSRCGCGPNQIFCFPDDHRVGLRNQVVNEIGQRGAYSYAQNQSWSQMLAGSNFYGDKLLYYYYLVHGIIMAMGTLPSDAELATLASLTIGTNSEVAMPSSGPERAGIATSPGFLKQFNNFRSRIRGLTEALLCKDVDGSLNKDGIAEFINSDLSDADVAHGELEGCAGCHYPMDNMGSMLFGWSDQGLYMSWRNWDQSGHSFGVRGEGPADLVNSYITHSGEFHDCMAKTAWEDFSGESWDLLSTSQKETITTAAQSSPRDLIRTILTSDALKSMRSSSAITTASIESGGAEVSFTTVNAILETSCSGSGCHSSDSSLGSRYVLVGNKAQWDQINTGRLNDGSMPPAGSGKTLSAEDLAILNRYFQ